MFLEEIEIEGFKSYGTKTRIAPMDKAFTAITGLNGTGKSNVLDAVCFVLGIDCPRLLRSASMKDLIFKHAQSSRGEARATLFFNNKESASSPPGYEGVSRISLARVISEDGKTKHLLNGQNATNKSVTRLLQSVGLSTSKSAFRGESGAGRKYEKTEPPYFIVMQGRVGKILGMKSAQFLTLLEECAGTGVYRAEKHRAYATLEKKEKKLLETQDTLSKTIFPFLERLRKERSEFYASREAQNKLAGLKESMEQHRCTLAYLERKRSEQELKDLAFQAQRTDADLSALSAELAAEQEQIEDIDIVELQKEIDTKQRASSHIMVDVLEESLKKAKSLLAETQKKQKALIANYRAQPLPVPCAPSTPEDVLISMEVNLAALAQKEKTLRKDLSAGLTARAEKEKEKEALDTALHALRAKEKSIEKEIERLCSKHALTEDKARANIDLHAKGKPENVQHLQRQIGELRSSLAYPLIEGVHGKISELISVPNTAHGIAVGVVLGGRKEYVVVENESVGKQVIDSAAASGRRVDVIPLSRIVSRSIPVQKEEAARKYGASLLLESVTYPPHVKKAAEYIFGGYVLSADRHTAIQLRDKEGLTSVTLEGELFDRRGTITGGSLNTAAFVLSKSQRHAILDLESRLARSQEILQKCPWTLLEHSQKVKSLAEERKETCTAIQKHAASLSVLESGEKPEETSLEETVSAHTSIASLQRQIAEAQRKAVECAREIERTEEKIEAGAVQAAALQKEIDALEKRKTEGLKKNEVNRARRSIQMREEKRVSEEILLLKKEKTKIDAKIARLKQEKPGAVPTPHPPLLSEHPSTLSSALAELEASYTACLKVPRKDINPKNIEMLEKNEDLEKTLKERISKLKKNKETIQKSIAKLNALEKQTIEQVFHAVNKRIGKYIQYFIPNGDAKLECVDGSPMNGVELLVKIGTWKKGLTELSGGQKSICALSLIFSLLKAKPSPLYILDEIDAALDASHTEAMGRMIQSEFQGSQFLVVSLKDGMYHNANALFQTYIREGTSGIRKV
ncbi:structural maintenance of chromosome 2 [Nematocida sp. AWRm77]|nr:structural maintenance of chromosome 2 [Nematocida sp. AWRm77]